MRSSGLVFNYGVTLTTGPSACRKILPRWDCRPVVSTTSCQSRSPVSPPGPTPSRLERWVSKRIIAKWIGGATSCPLLRMQQTAAPTPNVRMLHCDRIATNCAKLPLPPAHEECAVFLLVELQPVTNAATRAHSSLQTFRSALGATPYLARYARLRLSLAGKPHINAMTPTFSCELRNRFRARSNLMSR